MAAESPTPEKQARFALKDSLWLIIGVLAIGLPLWWLSRDKNDDSIDQPPDGPQIIFLGPASAASPNLHLLTIGSTKAEPITDVPGGILDYAISPDGQWAAYAAQRRGILSDIWAVNLQSHQSIQLTNCVDAEASCDNPSWHPSSAQIAYTRREYSQSSGRAYTDRVWVVDLATRTAKLLFDDVEQEGCCPKWSPVGERIALFAPNPQGVLVYDFPAARNVFIPTGQGLVGGAFSPDGSRLIYPVLRIGAAGGSYYQHFQMAHFGNFGEQDPIGQLISGAQDAPVEDLQAAFHPDGQHVALVRRRLDSGYTIESQIYILDLATQTVQQITSDPAYSNGSISWNSDGDLLLMQRYQENPETGRGDLSIWVYRVSTGELQKVYDDGFLPKFVP